MANSEQHQSNINNLICSPATISQMPSQICRLGRTMVRSCWCSEVGSKSSCIALRYHFPSTLKSLPGRARFSGRRGRALVAPHLRDDRVGQDVDRGVEVADAAIDDGLDEAERHAEDEIDVDVELRELALRVDAEELLAEVASGRSAR